MDTLKPSATIHVNSGNCTRYGYIVRKKSAATLGIGRIRYETDYVYFRRNLGMVKSMASATVYEDEGDALNELKTAGYEENECEVVKVQQTIRVMTESAPEGEFSEMMRIHCSDGDIELPYQHYMECLDVSNFIENEPDWIHGHTKKEVSERLQELYGS